MDAASMQRPAIPRQYYEPNLAMALVYFAFSASFIVLPGYASVAITKSALDVWLKVALCLPLIVIAGHGFHLFGWFAHEGIHLSLAKDKYLSMTVGILISGITLFPAMGYGITHWNHHRYTNQDSDPDTKIYPKYRTFWGRFFLARLTANRGYMRNSILLALGKLPNKGYTLPFTDAEQRRFAILTLFSLVAWMSGYLFLTYLDPVAGVVGVFLPILTSIPFTGLRIYLEHNGTDNGVFRDTRTYSSRFYTFLMFGNNLHLEHHLYPRVPCYHLAKVHRYLRDNGYYDKWRSHIVGGIVEPLRYVGSDYQYPDPQGRDLVMDPFRVEALSEGAAADRAPAS